MSEIAERVLKSHTLVQTHSQTHSQTHAHTHVRTVLYAEYKDDEDESNLKTGAVPLYVERCQELVEILNIDHSLLVIPTKDLQAYSHKAPVLMFDQKGNMA